MQQSDSQSNAIQALRRRLSDIFALSASPVARAIGQPEGIPAALADALLDALSPDFVYLLLNVLPGEPAVEVVRCLEGLCGGHSAQVIGQRLARYLKPEWYGASPLVRNPIKTGMIRITVTPVGDNGAAGVIVIGSQQPDFPTEIDRLLINVAANEAFAARQTARLVAERAGYAERLEELAEASVAITAAPSLDEMLATVAERAAQIIGAHQAMANVVISQDWAQANSGVYLSEKYAAFREDRAQLDGRGIYALVCETNQPVCMTQAELEADPRWHNAGRKMGIQPAMRGWLAAPLTARNGENLGLIQLSDKFEGEFTAEDREILIRLAQLSSAAIEKIRSYEEARESVKARDDMLAKVSHDLSNSLHLVLSYSRLLSEEEMPEEAISFAQTINEAAQMMQRLIQDLLDVSRIEMTTMWLEPQPVEVEPLVQEARQMFAPLAAQQGLALEMILPPDLPQVAADRERILQVFQNLLSNALKFTTDGRITLRAELLTDAICFSVEDTGCGIPAEELPHLFDRFWQVRSRSHAGAGLGLAIARGIVEAHGGRIWAESRLEEGSTFFFTLPVA